MWIELVKIESIRNVNISHIELKYSSIVHTHSNERAFLNAIASKFKIFPHYGWTKSKIVVNQFFETMLKYCTLNECLVKMAKLTLKY